LLLFSSKVMPRPARKTGWKAHQWDMDCAERHRTDFITCKQGLPHQNGGCICHKMLAHGPKTSDAAVPVNIQMTC
jgi:hypothetical protein